MHDMNTIRCNNKNIDVVDSGLIKKVFWTYNDSDIRDSNNILYDSNGYYISIPQRSTDIDSNHSIDIYLYDISNNSKTIFNIDLKFDYSSTIGFDFSTSQVSIEINDNILKTKYGFSVPVEILYHDEYGIEKYIPLIYHFSYSSSHIDIEYITLFKLNTHSKKIEILNILQNYITPKSDYAVELPSIIDSVNENDYILFTIGASSVFDSSNDTLLLSFAYISKSGGLFSQYYRCVAIKYTLNDDPIINSTFSIVEPYSNKLSSIDSLSIGKDIYSIMSTSSSDYTNPDSDIVVYDDAGYEIRLKLPDPSTLSGNSKYLEYSYYRNVNATFKNDVVLVSIMKHANIQEYEFKIIIYSNIDFLHGTYDVNELCINDFIESVERAYPNYNINIDYSDIYILSDKKYIYAISEINIRSENYSGSGSGSGSGKGGSGENLYIICIGIFDISTFKYIGSIYPEDISINKSQHIYSLSNSDVGLGISYGDDFNIANIVYSYDMITMTSICELPERNWNVGKI